MKQHFCPRYFRQKCWCFLICHSQPVAFVYFRHTLHGTVRPSRGQSFGTAAAAKNKYLHDTQGSLTSDSCKWREISNRLQGDKLPCSRKCATLIWVQFLAANMVVKKQRWRRKNNLFLGGGGNKYRTIFFAIEFHASYLPHFHVQSTWHHTRSPMIPAHTNRNLDHNLFFPDYY